MRPIPFAAALLMTTGSLMAQIQETGHPMSSDGLTWMPAPPVLPKGAQVAVLAGDPGKAGPFTIRLQVPEGYRIPAHKHPTDERVTVITGTFHVGMGDKLDEAKADALDSGGFVNLPANMNHFAFADRGAVVQIDSEGPFAITYADPKDDPSRTQ